jgi:cytochrome c oxidase cbb3-type subunit 3
MKPLVWFVSVCTAMMLAAGAHAQDEPNALIGSHLYRSYCLVCHGADGKGAGPIAINLNLEPADLSAEQYRTGNVEDLAAIIGDYRGQAGAGMPNWGAMLSREELLDIAAYIPKINEKDLRFTGDTRRGRVIFKRACVACHGQIGTGRGLLAQLIQIPMMDFTESENMKKMTDGDLLKIIREGKGDYMPSWKGILGDNEIADVASYVRMLAR